MNGTSEPHLVIMPEASRQLGVERHTLSRWLRDGKIKGEQDPDTKRWRVDVNSVPKHLIEDHRFHHSVLRSTAGDLGPSIRELREEISDLKQQIREKDSLIADLTRKLLGPS